VPVTVTTREPGEGGLGRPATSAPSIFDLHHQTRSLRKPADQGPFRAPAEQQQSRVPAGGGPWLLLARGSRNYQGPSPGSSPAGECLATSDCRREVYRSCGRVLPLSANDRAPFGQAAARGVSPIFSSGSLHSQHCSHLSYLITRPTHIPLSCLHCTK
jgi:hypothetical protein